MSPQLPLSKVFPDRKMGRSKIKRTVLLTLCAGLLAFSVGGANAALIKVGNLVLKTDGGFRPTALPRDHYAPIDFRAHADLINTEGGAPTPLQELRLDFDRNGKLETKGLPVCPPARIAHANTGQARKRCADALVGTGHVGAIFFFEGEGVSARVKASLFNGPRKGGNPTVIGHAFTTIPRPRTYVVVIPIERRKGAYSYRATFDVPKISAEGVLTHIDGRIGRRYVHRGDDESYASARCPTGVLKVHGHLLFTDGTIIDGVLEKPCTPVPLIP
jgi:hypothetical protein